MFVGLLLRIFMGNAMFWKQNIHTALSVISRHVPFCFPALILAVSATKWLVCLGLQRITTLQSPLSLFHFGRHGLYVGLVCHKRDSRCLLKCSRQVDGCRQQFIYITGQGYMCMCVSQFKITFRAGDGCVPDCRVAARLKSSPLASHALFLSLFSGLRLQGWRGGQEQWVMYEAAWERWEGPAIPCQEGTVQGERLHTLKCHFLQFTTPLLPQLQRPGWGMRLMKNGSHYELEPSWSLLLNPTSYKCDPVATSQPSKPPHTNTHTCSDAERPFFSTHHDAFRLVMTIYSSELPTGPQWVLCRWSFSRSV